MLKPFQNLIPPSGGTRFPALDGLRGLACLAVAAGHLHLFPLAYSISFSYMSVCVFFVLSAFLLTYPYAVGKKVNTKSYYIRRSFRIWPAYIVAIIAAYFVGGYVGQPVSLSNLFSHLTFTHTLFPDYAQSLIGAAWSLPAEMQFYAILPLLAIPLCRNPRRFFLVAIPLAVALQVILIISPFNVFKIQALNWPYLALPFIFGMAAALCVARGLSRSYLALLGGTGITLYGFWLFTVAGQNLPLIFKSFLAPRASFVALSTSLLIVGLCSNKGLICKTLSTTPIRLLGVAGYGIFLFHMPVYFLVTKLFNYHICQQIGLPLAILVGIASYFCVESPCIRLAHKVRFSLPSRPRFVHLFLRSNTSAQSQSTHPYSPAANPDTMP